MKVSDAGLVATDAGSNVVARPGQGQCGQIRIADEGSRHDAGVRLAGSEDPLGVLGLVDPSGDEHQSVHDRLDPFGERRGVSVGM